MLKTAYHIKDGAVSMYEIDAMTAIANFPNEWKDSPWTDEEKAAVAAPDASKKR